LYTNKILYVKFISNFQYVTIKFLIVIINERARRYLRASVKEKTPTLIGEVEIKDEGIHI